MNRTPVNHAATNVEDARELLRHLNVRQMLVAHDASLDVSLA
jgi:hypothetical protein